jgi:hypothetical protein
MKERNHLETPKRRCESCKMELKNEDVRVGTGFNWLKMKSSNELL